MLAATCQKFPTLRPSEVFGITDEVVAMDFNNAAAWIHQRGEDLKAIELLKAEARMFWGASDDDAPRGNGQTVNYQSRANEFFQ